MLLVALSSPGQWCNFSIIRLCVAYIDLLGYSRTQIDFDGAIGVRLFKSIRISLSQSQFSWVGHFLQDLMAWIIVIFSSLPVGMGKILIDHISLLKDRAPGVLPSIVVVIVLMMCMALANV